jgi:probable addiction module antidote protein
MEADEQDNEKEAIAFRSCQSASILKSCQAYPTALQHNVVRFQAMQAGKRPMSPTADYRDDLCERLSDPSYAAGYLSACADEGREELLRGLRNVAEALGGLNRLAEETSLNRENLYKMLSEGGNPRLSSVLLVLDALGLGVQFRCREAS